MAVGECLEQRAGVVGGDLHRVGLYFHSSEYTV